MRGVPIEANRELISRYRFLAFITMAQCYEVSYKDLPKLGQWWDFGSPNLY